MEIITLIVTAFLLFRPQVAAAASVNTDCGNVAIDLFFLIDSSGSVGEENFGKIKQFIADTAHLMTIGPHEVQIGLTTFGGRVLPQFNLSTYSSVGPLANATMKVDYIHGGGTHTGLALEWIEKNAFTKENGDRSDADNVLIVVTDGQSNDQHMTLSRAADLHRHNITIYAIGVGGNNGLDMEELTAIASDESHKIIVKTFDELHSLGTNITKRECNEKRSTLVPKSKDSSIFTMSHTQPSETQTFPSIRNDVLRNNTKSSIAHSTLFSIPSTLQFKHLSPTSSFPLAKLTVSLLLTSKALSSRPTFLSSKGLFGQVLSSAQKPVQSHQTVASSNTGSDRPTFLMSKSPFGQVLSSVYTPVQPHQTVVSSNSGSDWYCRISACVHGTCVPLTSEYLCICEQGYIGKNCDVDEDDCRSQPCVYGQCIDQVNGYHCQCSVMFSGKNCSKMRIWSTMAIGLGALLLLTVFCCCGLCCPARRGSDDDNEEKNRRIQRPFPTKRVEAWPR